MNMCIFEKKTAVFGEITKFSFTFPPFCDKIKEKTWGLL